MKNLLSFLAAAFVACLGFCGYAEALDHWVYGQYNSQNVISNGVWMFRATVASKTTNLTVGTAVDDTDPCQCPTNAVMPLDFSMPVIDGTDSTKQYTIVNLSTAFHPNNGTTRVSAGCVGKLTLPGDGLTTLGGEAFRDCTSLSGDLVIPSTVTSIGRYGFQNSKITSVTFGATAGATISSEVFTGCRTMTNVTFLAGGKWTIQNNARPFNGCWAIVDIDLSGLISSGGDANHAAFGGCTALTNAILNSDIVLTQQSSGTYWYGLFKDNAKLATIRFTGAAPDELDNWISGDGGYLGLFSSSQSITTIVPAEYRKEKNSSGKSWQDYSASGALNTTDSTWASGNVKSDVTDLSKRKLLLDRIPEDDPPTISTPVVSDIWSYQATVTVGGSGLNGGKIFVSLTNATGDVTGPETLSEFGSSCTFEDLACSTEYAVIVVASNNYGTVTNSAVTFTTREQPPEVSVEKGGDADYNKSQNGSFIVSRASGASTDYELPVAYTVSGTAVAGTDYTALSGTATIPVGASSVTVSVTPLYCETSVSGDTSLSVSITDSIAYEVVSRTASISIKKVEAVHYSIAAGTNPTGSTRGTFIVSRGANDPIDQKVTLTYTVSGDGANAIFPLSGTVVIPPYATSATIEVFGNNASGSDVDLTVTLSVGSYTLITASATITITAGATSEYWLVDTSAKTVSWRSWTFSGVDTSSKTVSIGNAALKAYPSELSTLDFSLPVVDANGNRYVITQISMRGASAEAKAVVGELTLPGEGLTSLDYAAFSGCANVTGTLVFPTSCTQIGGECFNKCTGISILGSSITGWKTMSGKDTLVGVSFVGEALALSIEEVVDGGFYASNVGSIRFGPNLKKLGRADGRNGFFQNCTMLSNVVFDADSRVSLENGITFRGCTALKEIDLSPVTNITVGAFYYETKTNVNASTFYGCTALTNVIFGAELHNLASNVFEEAFKSLSANYSVTFKGLPPENFEMPYLSKLASTRVSSKDPYTYPTVTTYVHRDMVSTKNAAGKCWNDYAAGGKINSSGTTWASDYLPSDVPVAVRPLQTIEQGEKKKGFMLLVR